MPARRLDPINLLPKSELETSLGGRFLKWALGTGRYIVILTELVVIMAFMSRFKLDKDYADLADKITGKKAVLTAMESVEKKFRQTQGRVAAAKEVVDGTWHPGQVADSVVNKLPPGVTLSSLAVTKENVIVGGQANGEGEINILVGRLQKDPLWKSIEVVNLTSNPEGEVSFTIKLNL